MRSKDDEQRATLVDLGKRNDGQYRLLLAVKGDLGAEKRAVGELQARIEQLVNDRKESEDGLKLDASNLRKDRGRKERVHPRATICADADFTGGSRKRKTVSLLGLRDRSPRLRLV